MAAPRILVVEDERIIAFHLRQQLTKLGYEVPNAVSTGEHALRRIEEARPDLILMDINLKGRLDGIATVTAIPAAYRIPVIYLTAYAGDATLARAAATNPHGYLLKPFSGRELHAMIQVTLARSRLERTSQAAEERRRQARKMEALRHLAAGMADEVNELLTVLYGQLEETGHHADDRPVPAVPVQDAFGVAIDKEDLVRQLLEFSGRRKLAPSMASINELVARAAGRLRYIMGDTIQIQFLLPDNLWSAYVDSDQLTRALSNLAMNSQQAMPDGGRLTIEARNTAIHPDEADGRTGGMIGRYVELSVTDTGFGMTASVVERAFEPFFTTNPGGGGSGLGLSLVFGFIKQSGGHISIDSEPGNGTTVRLYIPATTDNSIIHPDRDHRRPRPQIASPDPQVALPGMDLASSLFAAPSIRRNGEPVGPGGPAAWADVSASPVLWRKAENALFASVAAPTGQVRHHLIVERLPRRGGWDWSVWQPGEPETNARHGRATSVESAMAAAEYAAGFSDNWASPGEQRRLHDTNSQ